jgi:hypothetical protein
MSTFAVAAPVPKDLPKVPEAFAGRFGVEKAARLKQFGGSDKTEVAVSAGLKWLASVQDQDGGWTFDTNDNASNRKNREAATGMALLAFLGSGHTSKILDKGPHAKVVAAGVKWLRDTQLKEGNFNAQQDVYAHAIATTALCEAAGMGDVTVVKAAQKALDYLVAAQNDDGSWGYTPKTRGDTSILGWQVQALRAGLAAKLKIDPAALTKAAKFLDETAVGADQGKYGYVKHSPATPTLTAVGLMSRTVLSEWTAETPGVKTGTEFVAKALPDTFTQVYLLYNASLSLPMAADTVWQGWNDKASALLLKGQTPAGKADAGSWPADTDYIGRGCGRLGTTAVAVLTLENYYRYPFPLKAAKK